MIRWLCIIIAASGSAAFAAPEHLVAFGDSTTATRGSLKIYAAILDEKLDATITNAGVGGHDTGKARARFERDVLNRKPNLVVIQFGINDAAVDVWKKPPAKDPRVSKSDYETNLRFFIREIRKAGGKPILMTPNPIRWTPKLKTLYGKRPYDPDDDDGFNVLLRDYAEIARKIAGKEKVPLIDVYAEFQKRDVDSLLLDGMHPNAKGHELVAKLLLPVVEKVSAGP